MKRGFRRRHREDQPAMSGVYGRKSKDISKKGAVCFRILTVDDHMSAKDHEVSPFLLRVLRLFVVPLHLSGLDRVNVRKMSGDAVLFLVFVVACLYFAPGRVDSDS